MTPGDVCHGPRCSLAGLGPVAFEYRSCHWPGESAGSPKCVRPMGCWFFPVPRPPYMCAVSWAAWLLFTGVPARFVSVASAVSLATWLLFTGVLAWCVVLRVPCPGPLGSRSPVGPLGVLCCVCGVPGHFAPVHRCARSVCCFACTVSWATWLLFTGVPARCVVLRVRCPGPLGSCSAVCPLVVLFCVCGVLGHLAPVHRCARSVCCVTCAVFWATWLLFSSAPAGCAVVCAVSWVTCLLFTGAPARCVALRVRCPGPLGFLFTGVPAPLVVLRVRCPGPPGSCSPVRPLSALCCVCGVLGNLASDLLCASSVCCFACAASWAPWLLFTGVPTPCVVLRVRCPGPLGSCSPVCPLGVLCCVCGVLGHLAPVHRCARSVLCFARAVSWATWVPFTGVTARCVVLLVWCPGPPGSCSPVCPLSVLCCLYGVLGHLTPDHQCARSVCCVTCAVFWATWLLFSGAPAGCAVVCAVSWATWLLFTGAPARCAALRVRCPGPLGFLFTGVPAPLVVLRVRCPGPPGSCSPVRPLGALCCVCGVLGNLASDLLCASSVCCFACAASWAPWLLFTGVPTPCVVLRVRCPGPLGSCSPVCPLGVLCCVCGVLGHFAPVHRCARSVLYLASAVSWATWVPFTGVPARCVVLLVWCPGPPGSCSPVCPLSVLCCVHGVLGHLAPVHRCVRSVCCFACAVSWATWLLFNGVSARCVVSRVWCPGPLGSCSPVRPLRPLLCLCGVPGHLAPVHRCARSVCCYACAVSWATWLPFTGAPAPSLALLVRCPGPLGSRSPVRPLRHLLCSSGVLGHSAAVHRCARAVCCFACAVSWANSLLFTGVPARCVVLRVRCPGPLGSCSPVRPLRLLLCLCGVPGHLAPVHRCARSVCCFACAVSWATWLLFTGVLPRCVVLLVRCPGPLGSCSPVCPLGGLRCVYGVLGRLALVHRCARSVCCALGCACGVVWAGRRCGALTRPSGQRLFVAGRGWVPSGRTPVHPDGGCS